MKHMKHMKSFTMGTFCLCLHTSLASGSFLEDAFLLLHNPTQEPAQTDVPRSFGDDLMDAYLKDYASGHRDAPSDDLPAIRSPCAQANNTLSPVAPVALCADRMPIIVPPSRVPPSPSEFLDLFYGRKRQTLSCDVLDKLIPNPPGPSLRDGPDIAQYMTDMALAERRARGLDGQESRQIFLHNSVFKEMVEKE